MIFIILAVIIIASIALVLYYADILFEQPGTENPDAIYLPNYRSRNGRRLDVGSKIMDRLPSLSEYGAHWEMYAEQKYGCTYLILNLITPIQVVPVAERNIQYWLRETKVGWDYFNHHHGDSVMKHTKQEIVNPVVEDALRIGTKLYPNIGPGPFGYQIK